MFLNDHILFSTRCSQLMYFFLIDCLSFPTLIQRTVCSSSLLQIKDYMTQSQNSFWGTSLQEGRKTSGNHFIPSITWHYLPSKYWYWFSQWLKEGILTVSGWMGRYGRDIRHSAVHCRVLPTNFQMPCLISALVENLFRIIWISI